MANGRFNLMQVTEELLKAHNAPWDLAPADLLAAKVAVDAAKRAHVDAIDAVNDAEVNVPGSQAQWEADARSAVAAGKPLPSRDPLDRARIELDLAREDERKVRTRASTAVGALASLLSDEDTRTAWRLAIDARLDQLDDQLNDHAATISPLVREAVLEVGLTIFLGEWLMHRGPYLAPAPDAIGALRTVAALRRYDPAAVAGNITA